MVKEMAFYSAIPLIYYLTKNNSTSFFSSDTEPLIVREWIYESGYPALASY